MKFIVFTTFAASVLFLQTASGQIPSIGQAAGSGQAPPALDTVVAVVDGKPVTVEDVDKMISVMPPNWTQLFRQEPQEAIRQYYLLQYLAKEGEAQKIAEKSPIKEQLEAMRANIVAGAYVNQERDGYQVTQEMIEEVYKANLSKYEQATIKIIYVGFKPGLAAVADVEEAAKAAIAASHPFNERPEDEAKALAEDISKKLKEGANFAEMVEKFSDDPTSKAAGGDFGEVKSTSSYSEDLKRSVLSLKEGEISDPIRQSNGFYIVKVDKKSVQPMAEVAEPIVQELRQKHLDDWLRQMNLKFQPVVQRPDFFVQPAEFIRAAEQAATPNK